MPVGDARRLCCLLILLLKDKATVLSTVFNFMLSLQKKFTLSGGRWGDVLPIQWPLSHFTKAAEYAFKTFDEMRNNGVVPEKVTFFLSA